MTIKKGTHAPIRLPRILISPSEVVYAVTFTDSCRYTLNNEDQLDINKLFGIGYFPSHHNNSIRFGWVCDHKVEGISIYAYWYANKVRKWEYMTQVPIGTTHYYSIDISGNTHKLKVHDIFPNAPGISTESEFSVDVKPSAVSYLLRPYFGGNQKAPHDITIKMV